MFQLLILSVACQLAPASVQTLPAGSTVPIGTVGIAMPLPIAIPGPAGPQGPPSPPSPSTPDPNSITTYGAIADGGQTDSSPAFYKAFAAGVTTAKIPQASKAFGYSRPILLPTGVTIAGESPVSSVLAATWGNWGPGIVVGVGQFDDVTAALHRPKSTSLDATASGGRLAFDTLGTAVATLSGCPMQLGYQAPPFGSQPPDYWGGNQYTLECLVSMNPWVPNTGIYGFAVNGQPQPFFMMTGQAPGSFQLCCWFANQPQSVYSVIHAQAAVAAPATTTQPTSYGLCFQLDTAGSFDCWINNANCPTTIQTTGGATYVPGTPLKAHNGITPLVIGSQYGQVPNANTNVSVVQIGYLNFSKGKKYVSGRPTQVPIDGSIISDAYRGFSFVSTATAQTIGFLKGTDSPGTTLDIQCAGGTAQAFVIPAVRIQWPSQNNAIRQVGIKPFCQPGIMVGESLGLKLNDLVISNGMQGIGPVGTNGVSYRIRASNLDLGGADCGWALFRSIVSAHDTSVTALGRDGIRIFGGMTSWYDTHFYAGSPIQQTLVDLIGDDGGSDHTFYRIFDDDESSNPSDASIRAAQSPYAASSITVEKFSASRTDTTPIVHLTGPGIQPGVFSAGTFFGVGPHSVPATVPTAVLVDPGSAWQGEFNTMGLAGPAAVTGAGIKRLPAAAVVAPPTK